MLPLLLLSFIIVPIVELAVIAQVGGVLGFWPTLLILVADSLIGAVLVRKEGRRAWHRFRAALSDLRWPGDEVVQGGLVLIGGALLLTPGFVTDVVGLLAVIPPTRAVLSRLIRARVRSLAGERVGMSEGPRPDRSRDDRRRGATYDVEVVSVERDEPSADDPADDAR